MTLLDALGLTTGTNFAGAPCTAPTIQVEPDQPPVPTDEVFFSEARGRGRVAAQQDAVAVCLTCPVALRDRCAAVALDAERGVPLGYRHGVFGALTPRDRFDLDAMAEAPDVEVEQGMVAA